MKNIFLIALFLFPLAKKSSAQIEKPVTWSYAAKKINKSEAILYLKASIDAKWHIYSQNIKSGGPVKTTIVFSPSGDFVLNGKTIEPKAATKYESAFKMNVGYFENQVVFRQKIRLNKSTVIIKGKVEFAACDAKRCLPPEELEFSIPVKG